MAALLTVLAALTAAAPGGARAPHLALSLIASSEQPRPGSEVTLGLRFRPEAGWHGYWSNPGDSGLAPTVAWQAPPGVTFGSLEHPAPSLLAVAGLTSFVHAGEHVLLTHARIPRSLAAGALLPISAEVRWLACSATLCVPEHATVAINLRVGDGAPGPDAVRLRQARAALPRVATVAAPYAVRDGAMRLVVPASFTWDIARLRFFPDDNGVIDVAAMKAVREPGGFVLVAPLARKQAPRHFTGVLSDGRHALRVSFVERSPGGRDEGGHVATANVADDHATAPSPARTMADVRAVAPVPPAGPVTAKHRSAAPSSPARGSAIATLVAALGALAAAVGLLEWRRQTRTREDQ